MEFDFRLPNYRHQDTEFKLHRDDPARALIWQMRTGKSKAMIDLACYLFKACEIDAVIVVAPNNVHLNWQRRELPKHLWTSVSNVSFVWDAVKSTNINYDFEFKNICKEQRKLRWYMLNVEALGNSKGKKYLADFIKSCWRILLIVDEVHEFRWSTSNRSKALRGLANKVAYKRILSANPTDNSPLHSFAEYEILKPGALGFKKFAEFENHYAIKEEIYVPGGYTKDGIKRKPRKRPVVTGYKNQEELRAKIAKWSSLVLRDEVDELPDLINDKVYFELLPIQKRLHNDLVRNALAKLDGGDIIQPAEGGVLIIRLQQIASGFAISDEGQVINLMPDKDNPRLIALFNVAKQASGKFIVWCRFREDVIRVTRFLNCHNFGAVDYYGATSKQKRLQNEDSFRNNPKCRALVGQYQAGGQGLDFSSASDIFWYSHTSDLLRRRQANERATQIGGRKISVIDIIASGSNDEKMLTSLENREITANYLTGTGLRNYLELIR